MQPHDNLETLLRNCWNLLFRAAVQKRHELRTPVLTTGQIVENSAYFGSRTVVLRATEVAARRLTFYTDWRSDKVADLQRQAQHVWHFYDKKHQTQMRLTAQAVIHHQNERARKIWQNIPPSNRKDYCALQPPGAKIEHPQAATPTFFLNDEATAENTEYGYQNFVVIDAVVDTIDWLHLHRAGHQRAQFRYADEEWLKWWVVP